MSIPNTIFIGDIHSCSLEFRKLLDILSPSAGDNLILLGDLLNKGPDPEPSGGISRKIQAEGGWNNNQATDVGEKL